MLFSLVFWRPSSRKRFATLVPNPPHESSTPWNPLVAMALWSGERRVILVICLGAYFLSMAMIYQPLTGA